MDPSLRLSCEELLELPYFQEDGGGNWGRDGERPGRRHDKGSRRRQAGVRNHPITPKLETWFLRPYASMFTENMIDSLHLLVT